MVMGTAYPGAVYVEDAATVKVDLAVLDPGVIETGENEQFTPAGKPEQERLIALLNPPTALEFTEMVVDSPTDTVALCVESASEKSAVVVAAAGTGVANKPEVWFAPPAVKYSVLDRPCRLVQKPCPTGLR